MLPALSFLITALFMMTFAIPFELVFAVYVLPLTVKVNFLPSTICCVDSIISVYDFPLTVKVTFLFLSNVLPFVSFTDNVSFLADFLTVTDFEVSLM